MEDWDLQAIVKGCSKGASTHIEDHFEDPDLYSLLSGDDGFSCIFPGFEGLGNSLYPVFHPLIPHPNSSSSISLLREFQQPKKLHQKNQTSPPTKQKPSKKSRQNRVVKHVKADDICSDSWAWRKYGQKPIKGSPHPRSYYRCSSSKGCSARKQVERSLSDSDIFIITYTADHNHVEPTRRNALAGSSRKKFSIPENTVDDVVVDDGNSPNVDMVLSPTSASTEEELNVDGGFMMNMPFGISGDDVFSGLEDLLYG